MSVILMLAFFSCEVPDNDKELTYFIVEKNGKTGVIGSDGTWLVELAYDVVLPFSDSFALVRESNKYGYVSLDGREVIKPDYENARDFHNGIAPVKKDGKWGFIDKNLNIISEFDFDSTLEYSEGYWVIAQGDQYGFIDSTGKITAPSKFDYCESFVGEFAAIVNNGYGGVIDKNAREYYFDSLYTLVQPCDAGMFIAADSINEYLITKTGAVVYQTNQRHLTRIQGLRGFCFLDSGFVHLSVINPKGEMILDSACDFISFEGGAFFIFGKYGQFGLSDTNGRSMIAPNYSSLHSYSNGLLSFFAGAGYGYIDTAGQIVIDSKYESTGPFISGKAVVKWVNKYGVINQTDENVIPFEYEYLKDRSWNGYFAFKTNGQWGVIDQKGTEIITPAYDQIYGAFKFDANGNSIEL